MIPGIAHFVWIGGEFSWLSFAALASARLHGGFERVVLHHTHALDASAWFRRLPACDVECRRLDAAALLEQTNVALVDLYRDLPLPAAQSNLLRVALLERGGGVYLDLDTLTVRSLAPLRAGVSAFCGLERIAFPANLSKTLDLRAWAGAYGKTLLRDVCRRSRSGVRWFRGLERLFPVAANNAVLGAGAGHPLLSELLARMLALPRARRRVRYALGTSLLQDVLATNAGLGVAQHAPDVFYPLGPEISEHWFRLDTRARLDDVLTPRTRVVHWYASVRSRKSAPRVEPSWVKQHADRQLISALARALVPEAS